MVIYISVYLTIFPTILLSLSPSVSLSIFYVSISLKYLSIYIYLHIYFFIYFTVYILIFYLFVHHYLAIYFFIYVQYISPYFIYLCISIKIAISLSFFLSIQYMYLYVYLSIYLYIYLSIYLSIYKQYLAFYPSAGYVSTVSVFIHFYVHICFLISVSTVSVYQSTHHISTLLHLPFYFFLSRPKVPVYRPPFSSFLPLSFSSSLLPSSSLLFQFSFGSTVPRPPFLTTSLPSSFFYFYSYITVQYICPSDDGQDVKDTLPQDLSQKYVTPARGGNLPRIFKIHSHMIFANFVCLFTVKFLPPHQWARVIFFFELFSRQVEVSHLYPGILHCTQWPCLSSKLFHCKRCRIQTQSSLKWYLCMSHSNSIV